MWLPIMVGMTSLVDGGSQWLYEGIRENVGIIPCSTAGFKLV